MNAADYLIVGVLLASMLLGMLRGFVREAVGLLAWLGGLWLAWRYAPSLEPLSRRHGRQAAGELCGPRAC